ncbi:membrane protein insertion efficiency factor YidD [Ostreibacterium oceani]|uniref:Putative membrane protein insertion efficiency factor n=1 Tax=Ostreibacterium oceani TaxID=2654998 RepID=A0A6N7EZ40_9GAMM|nr:membrane protein insertion efficiency factor YidD [Ostreibacterium oceani]MPV86629.1 membrane protein insertion efficiency factor YidD [Ostreibacterium oceani]
MRKILIALIKGYQWTLSPLIGNACRFYPTCSNYAIEAITAHGCIKGSYLAANRICRCQPLCKGGIDPVPEANPTPLCKQSKKQCPSNNCLTSND